MGTREYTLLNSNDPVGPGAVHKQHCAVEEQTDGGLHFYVMFPVGPADETSGTIYYYDLTKGKWHFVFASANERGGAAIHKIDRKVVVGGGEKWGTYIYKDLFLSLIHI